MDVRIKRVYNKFNRTDGIRILVDRLWPRGVRKEEAQIDKWAKDIAPSDSLRKWFNHEPEKWEEFKKKYFEELNQKRDLLEDLVQKGRNDIILLYAAKDEKYNNAAALKEYMEKFVLR